MEDFIFASRKTSCDTVQTQNILKIVRNEKYKKRQTLNIQHANDNRGFPFICCRLFFFLGNLSLENAFEPGFWQKKKKINNYRPSEYGSLMSIRYLQLQEI